MCSFFNNLTAFFFIFDIFVIIILFNNGRESSPFQFEFVVCINSIDSMYANHNYLINHSDVILAKPVLYLRKYWISMIESTRRSQKFFYLSGIRRLGKKSIMSHIARCDTNHKVIIIHADTLDRGWKDNASNIVEFLQYSVRQYGAIDVFIGEVELLNNYEILLDYIAQE